MASPRSPYEIRAPAKMRPSQIKDKAVDMEMNPQAAYYMRMKYLIGVIGRWDEYIAGNTNEMPPMTAMDALDEIIKIKRYAKRGDKKLPVNTITDDMIQTAKEYPIEKVIEFERGKAMAFCHNDKKPSLDWWKAGNRARCFPCSRTFSALDVLIERDGMSFLDAVRELQ